MCGVKWIALQFQDGRQAEGKTRKIDLKYLVNFQEANRKTRREAIFDQCVS